MFIESVVEEVTAGHKFVLKRKYQLLLIGAILLFGFTLRLYGGVAWNSFYPNNPTRLVGDETGYNNLAHDILDGKGITWPGRVPLYPTWLAIIFFFVGPSSFDSIVYVQAFLSTITIFLTYLLGKRLFGFYAGILAAFFASISYVLIHESYQLLSEVLYTPVILILTLALYAACQKPRFSSFAWAGFWLGVSMLIRPSLLLFPVASIFLFWLIQGRRKFWRGWAIYLLAAYLVITPWMIHNYVRYQEIFPLQTSNAFFWLASPEYYHMVREQGDTYLNIWSQVIYGPNYKVHDPNTVQGDRYWTKRAIDSILAEPLVYIKYAGEKLITYWIGDPSVDWIDSNVFNYHRLREIGYSRFDAIQFMISRIIPIIALFAGIYLRRHWRKLLPIYSIMLYLTLLHAATHAEARLSDPLQPFLLIIIAGAVIKLCSKLKPFAPEPQHLPTSPETSENPVSEAVS